MIVINFIYYVVVFCYDEGFFVFWVIVKGVNVVVVWIWREVVCYGVLIVEY